MAVLLDTNVLSELRKGRKANPQVLAWSETISEVPQFVSVLTLGEIRKGITVIKRKDSEQAKILDQWLSNVRKIYEDNVLPICSQVADQWGALQARRSMPVIDGLLAATARAHRLTLATRNTSDFEGVGVPVVNPFEAG